MGAPPLDPSHFDSIPEAIDAFRRNEFIVILDDPSRENEGDLVIAAEGITTQQMAFMIRHSSGLICAPLSAQRTEELKLSQMVEDNQDARGTAYTVSVDAANDSVTTGISAHDRALACRVLADPATDAQQHLRRPGHVFPLRARPGGVRQRRGHTEAAIDFCRLAGKQPAAVISELVDNGEAVLGQAVREGAGMLRGGGCIAFARQWGLKVCTIDNLVKFLGVIENNTIHA